MKKLRNFMVLVVTFILLINFTIPAKADEALILVTNDIVKQMAENFSDSILPDINLTAIDPIKFYDETGQAIGYIVNYDYNGLPYGYIVFDTTDNELVSEYAFGYDVMNPYQVIIETRLFSAFSSNEKLYKTAPFTYAFSNNAGVFYNNFGEEEKVVPQTISDDSEGKDPSDWEDIFIDNDSVYKSYTMLDVNHLEEFGAVSSSYVKQETGHYACAVSAAYICASYYGAGGNLAKDYMSLWNMTNTTIDSIGEDGIVYGSTTTSNTATGLVNFCESKGIGLAYRTQPNPSYSVFTNAIDNFYMPIIHCGINEEEGGTIERSGHAMPVEGYATIQPKSGGSSLHMLMVANGWDSGMHFLNLDFAYYTDTTANLFY